MEQCINKKNFYVEELSDPPPSYSHRAGSYYAINSTEHDMDLAPGYGSTQSAVVNVSSTRSLLGEQAPGNAHDLVQGYQQVVFSRFVCILLLLGCCSFLSIVSISLSSVTLSLDENISDCADSDCDPGFSLFSMYFFTTVSFVSLPLVAIVPVLTLCCCFLGIRSPQCNYCARITFYISTAIIGSIVLIIMLSGALVLFPVIKAFNSTASTPDSYAGCVVAITCTNFLAAIFGFTMLITAIYACIKDPQRSCSNQFVKVCVFIKFILTSGTLAVVMAALSYITVSWTIKYNSQLAALQTYSLAAIGCSGAYLLLVCLLSCLIGPLFCILEVRDSPFFSTILKYVMNISWIISSALFASGILSIIGSHLSHGHKNDLAVETLLPPVVVVMFSLSAVVNFIVAITITIIWFLFICSSFVHAIVLCCCLFCNL